MLYKLTDEKGQTHGGTQWGEEVTHKARERGKALCTESVIHCYRHPLLAVLFNPIHADFRTPLLWEATGRVVADDGLKVGCKKVTTIRQIPLPVITTEQRVKFAILVSLEVYHDKDYAKWARNWLDNTDRTEVAAWATAEAKAEATAGAARAAAWAARAAAWAAWATAGAAWAAAWAARAAARAGAWAVEVKTAGGRKINLLKIALSATK
jgi:hypothetical protein